MAGFHAKFSPSSAARVSACPASFLRSLVVADSPSWAAVEGTIAHALHEAALRFDSGAAPALARFLHDNPRLFLGDADLSPAEWGVVPVDWTVPQEMLDYVGQSVEYCREQPGRQFVETRVDISPYTPIPGQFGTCDFACIAPDGRLRVVDFKYGRGVKVYAEKNEQLALYALGFIHEYDFLCSFDRVQICVSQPRLDHYDVWDTSVAELQAIGDWLRQRFTLAMQPDAPFHPGEKACQFCPVKPHCPALYDAALAAAHGWFDAAPAPPPLSSWPLSAPDVSGLSSEQLAKVLDSRAMLEDFFASVSARALGMLMRGEDVPGYKLVEGRSFRQVADAAGYEALLLRHGVSPYKPQELIGLGEAEKALKGPAKKELSAFLSKPQGKPTLAPVSDKRECYSAAAETMFNVV